MSGKVALCASAHASFPLYAKGVERYRYEYAVFLLDKNIETVSWRLSHDIG